MPGSRATRREGDVRTAAGPSIDEIRAAPRRAPTRCSSGRFGGAVPADATAQIAATARTVRRGQPALDDAARDSATS